MKYYLVTAKCGHIGKNKYIECPFYVLAPSGKEASHRVRYMPRVKHGHKDAIISCQEISKETFAEHQRDSRLAGYFVAKSRQEQSVIFEQIEPLIKTEPSTLIEQRDQEGRRSKRDAVLRQIRKMNKHRNEEYDVGA